MPRKKKNKGGGVQPLPKSKKKAPQVDPQHVKRQKLLESFDQTSNKYTNVLFKRIRNTKKKLSKIATLESKPLDELDQDQKNAISRKEHLLAELSRLENIQADLVAQATQEERKDEPKQFAPADLIKSLMMLNVIVRQKCFDDPKSMEILAQRLNDDAETPKELKPVSFEHVHGVKLFHTSILGHQNSEPEKNLELSTSLAMNYVISARDVEEFSQLSYAQLRVLVDRIFALCTTKSVEPVPIPEAQEE